MIRIPELGLGTAALALVDEAEADRTLRCALDRGISYFDTAPLYGGGKAEERLGNALKSAQSANVFVSTKVGRYRPYGAAAGHQSGNPDAWDFSEAAVRGSIARSQDRLNREVLDCVFLHDIGGNIDAAFHEALPVMRELQRKGVIGLVGAGCNTVDELLSAVDAGAADAILMAGRWTLLDRSAGDKLLPSCKAAGTRIVAGGVLNSGLLAARPGPASTFDYRPATAAERARAQQLSDMAEAAGISLLSAALQFPRRHETVGTLLLGAASQDQLEDSMTALTARIPDSFWERAMQTELVP